MLDVDELITSLTFVMGPPPRRARHQQDPIMQLLSDGPRSMDEVSAELGYPPDEVMRRVTVLEIDGAVTTDGGIVGLAGGSE